MMEPPSFRSGSAFCTVKSAPFTLMLNILSKWLFRHRFERSEFSQARVGEDDIDPPLALTVL